MRRISIFCLLFVALISGCNNGKNRLDINTANIQVPPVIIHRYDLDLFRVSAYNLQEGLEKLKPAYRFFLGTDLNNQTRLAEMKAYLENPRNLDFLQAVQIKYANLTPIQTGLEEAFRHYRYYFPDARLPRVYSYISGGDYDYPIQYADSVMLIGLDNYLGKDYKVYVSDGLPQYRLEKMTSENIIPDCMLVLAKVTNPSQTPGSTLLDQMVEEGKQLYFAEAMIPSVNQRFLLGYSQLQLDWVIKNEAHVWAAIIENRLLYSTDGQIIRTFMADGPFTAEFSKESPSRLGAWIGLQIIEKYMENEDGITLHQLLQEPDAQKILTASGYKPEK